MLSPGTSGPRIERVGRLAIAALDRLRARAGGGSARPGMKQSRHMERCTYEQVYAALLQSAL